MNSAVSAYRGLLRATRVAFKEDSFMLTEARKEIRSKFEASRLVTNTEVINQQLAEAEEAAVFIKDFVVQGVLNEEGNFGTLAFTLHSHSRNS
eukprot:8853328-Pyramimonas_sp.AAC.2